MTFRCPVCGTIYTAHDGDGILPGVTKAHIECPLCPRSQALNNGVLMIPDSRLARLWRRVTQCWWIGHIEPLQRKNQYNEWIQYWNCRHCGKGFFYPKPERMDFPESDLR